MEKLEQRPWEASSHPTSKEITILYGAQMYSIMFTTICNHFYPEPN
jgi:hypothetical protein